MNDIPELEARELLALPSDCLDISEWEASARNPYVFTCGCGLLFDGVFKQLHVEILYAHRQDVKSTHMKFTVFKKTPQGPDRVFQLDINTNPRSWKNPHNIPHLHWGQPRVKENIDWAKFDFDEALRLFMQETNINFDPLPQLPGFSLK